GFDHYWGLRDGCCNYFNPGLQRQGEPVPAQKHARVWCDDAKVSNPFTPADPKFYTTDAFTDKALGWLKQYKNETNPFLLYLAYTAPHDPLMAPAEDIAKYKGKYDEGYGPIRAARWKKQQAIGLFDAKTCPLSKPEHRKWKSLSAKERKLEAQRMEVYAAMIDRMDRNIGRVVDLLREQGKLENTLILFASDNGASDQAPRPKQNDPKAPVGSLARWESLHQSWANVCDTPFRKYKSSSYEGGICTPMIAHWPKRIAKNKICRTTGHFVDILPTLAQLAGAQVPKTHNGQAIAPAAGTSLVPCFADKPLKRTAPLFFQWSKGKAAIDGKWKIVTHSTGKKLKWELYNLAADRTETTDLASANPKKVKKLADAWKTWEANCASK
ncbi:MAG: sulfatase-like hydrolase/transferase, partial [Phycisphaerales bacterium]|nr:sulfatase-like hydrolase/transferase [Phycisphaerales bacterium]